MNRGSLLRGRGRSIHDEISQIQHKQVQLYMVIFRKYKICVTSLTRNYNLLCCINEILKKLIRARSELLLNMLLDGGQSLK